MPTVENQVQVLLRNIPDRERIVFFVGAGISVSAGFPLWGPATASALRLAIERGLSVRAAAYAEEKRERFQYYEVFDILQDNLSEPAFIRIATEIFCKELRPSGIHRLLARITCRGIITTNFDECLSSAYVLEHDGLNPISDIRSAIATDRFFVVKPHGSVLNPRSMVLTTRGWQTVLQNGDFKDLLAQSVSESQLVFMGYGFKDPDFEHIWSQLLIERFFRLPAIYCCHEGALPAEQLEQFRQKNVQVLNFPDNGSFEYVPSILQKLLEHGSATSHVVNATLPGVAAQELEKYVFLCIQFSPLQQNRLLLVSKAIALDYFSRATNDQITETKLLRHVCEMLGQDSFLIKQSGEAALKELIADGIVHLEADELKPDAAKLRAISAEVVKIDAAEREWVGRVLAKQVRQLGVEIDAEDRDNVVHVFDIVLLELGRDLAELILFNRPPKDEFKRVDESVDEITKILDISDKRELYKRVVRNLLFEPEGNEEELLFKKIQAYFISTAYVLNPTSEKLLAQYARDHWVYFDASVILPALALGHPSNGIFKTLLRRSQALGMRLMLLEDMFNEVWANVRMAISAFHDFGRGPASLEDALRAYIVMHGLGHGNVFLEGYLGQLELDSSLTPQAYMSAVFFTSKGLNISPSDAKKTIAESYGIQFDSIASNELDTKRLESLVNSIEHLRKQGDRYHSRRLCEHEARQFYLLHLRRQQNPELAMKIWYVTTDRFVIELQRLERDNFPLPISYTPRSWFQYLALVDVESRSSRNFARLQPTMRFGVLTGEIGIDAIRMIIQEQKGLLEKGIVTLKELANAAVTDFNVRQVMADVDKSVRRDEALQAEGKERIRQTISKVTNQYVAVRVDEIDKLKREAAQEKQQRIKVEKQLAKERYVTSTLKTQQQPRKKRKRRH